MMNKKELLEKLVAKAQGDLDAAKAACESTKSLNKAEDLKQEGKYDTRAIEAGYLAGAQQKRVAELELEVQMLEEIPERSFKAEDEVAIGAVVELELNGKLQKYFVCTTAGGSFLKVGAETVLVISVFSPIGKEVLGCFVGDTFELQTPKDKREYTVRTIF